LENIKNINDKFGHYFVDKLLFNVGKRLASLIEQDDILFKFQGDEFILIINNLNLVQKAISKAKKEGENNYHILTKEKYEEHKENLKMVEDLTLAISKDEFFLEYQPIVNPKREIVSYEALVRWKSPSRGIILPGRFIPILEKMEVL